MSDLKQVEESLSGIKVDLDNNAMAGASSAAGDSNCAIAWPASRVRQTFIEYFEKKCEHVFWPSSPVVPLNDPTLLFANSGMNQYKSLFLGTCDPSVALYNLKRAANSQKCIRAGGKHNDLEDVGKDVYHHTFFEMLGNWSFGDYFKREAIDWAWELLTVHYQLDPTRLYASYFGGDAKSGLAMDEEARNLWLRYLPPSRVLPFGMKENFWEMGPTGPCGPCSEIHYDRIGGRDAAARVNADVADVIEIWNLVFMQYNREADGSLKELPAKHVDTGMGLERITSILQDKQSNYDTDVFMPLFEEIQAVSGNTAAYGGRVGKEDVDLRDMAYRVVADHIRTLTFAITDGAVPSSEGRGYVLRRILRRAVRYGQEILGAPNGFFTKLVPRVIANLSDFFPELANRGDYVMSVISDEEASFNRTLDQGVKHFNKVVASLNASGSTTVSGKDAHVLFSSMGFPLDLTELMAAERGLTVDTNGFHELMEHDRKLSEMAEAARKGSSSKDMSMEAEQTAWLQGHNVPQTDSEAKYVWYENPAAKVLAVFTGRGGADSGLVERVQYSTTNSTDNLVGIVLDSTPFYYESGGQIFDTGVLKVGDATVLDVINTQSYGGYVLHVGHLSSGVTLAVGADVTCHVDYARRACVAPNHTMTHVLNYAIRKTLMSESDVAAASGTAGSAQCDQKGSLVDAEKLRFDFSWGSSLTPAQVAAIESTVQQVIKAGLPVSAEKVSLASAFEISGLRAIFGEQYPDPVRVISVGNSVQSLLADPRNPSWTNYSIEFCGGTHLTNTSQAVDFVLVEESGIAKGIRRITALTKNAALASRQIANSLLDRLDEMLRLPGGKELLLKSKAIKIEIDTAVVSLVTKEVMRAKQQAIFEVLKKWSKSREASRLAEAVAAAETLAKEAKEKNQRCIVASMDFGAEGKVAKKVQEVVKTVNPAACMFLISADDEGEKIGMFALVAPPAAAGQATLNAKAWCDYCTTAIGKGRGGGKADMANANMPVEAAKGETADSLGVAILEAARKYLADNGAL